MDCDGTLAEHDPVSAGVVAEMNMLSQSQLCRLFADAGS